MRHTTRHRPGLPVGILLAAGLGSRFDPAGLRNKLTEPLPAGPNRGLAVAFVAARRMRAALPRVVAVVRPASLHLDTLSKLLADAGCEVIVSADAEHGMGAALAAAVRATADAPGWLVALADMPAIAPATIEDLATALTGPGADAETIVAPFYEGRRGHPVGFGPAHGPALARLDGDEGARGLLTTLPVRRFETLDAGVIRDVDTPLDLSALGALPAVSLAGG
ncbi:MAG: nucleotidyltransferase family protein [Pararobbsia sp.]